VTAPVTQAQRTPWVDQLRGLAVVWMVGYHLCFDLDWLGFTDFDMLGDPWWTTQRAAIVGLFVWTAGVSQVLAVRGQQSRAGFWRRWRPNAPRGLSRPCATRVSTRPRSGM
jgi:uncharacterized membrane protein